MDIKEKKTQKNTLSINRRVLKGNMQKLCNFIERPNLQIMSTEEGGEVQA
jgi:hypothetical protein